MPPILRGRRGRFWWRFTSESRRRAILETLWALRVVFSRGFSTASTFLVLTPCRNISHTSPFTFS